MAVTGRDEGGMEWRGCRRGRSGQAGCGFGGRGSGCADQQDTGSEDGDSSLGLSAEHRAAGGCGEHAAWAVGAGTCGASEEALRERWEGTIWRSGQFAAQMG